MKRTRSSLSAASCAVLFFPLAILTASCETVGNWPFDDGIPTNRADILLTSGNISNLNATATFKGTGSPPRFDPELPSTQIWSGFCGSLVNENNKASLRFINAGLPANTNSQDGGCVTVPDTTELRTLNLTVETFVKVDRRVNWPLIIGKRRTDGNGTSWNLDMDNAGRPRVRIDSQPIGNTSGGGWNQSWTASVPIEDGQWHHLAFTYSHTNRAVRLYVDHILRASGNSFSNLVYDSGELRIGQGAGGRAFDGWIDEIRLSNEVLPPEQFMSTREPSPTLGYWTFDDGINGNEANTLTSLFSVPFMNGTSASISGGTKPLFSDETPKNTTSRISDGINGPLVNTRNTTALRFINAGLPENPSSKSGGQIAIAGAALQYVPTPSFTAEAFIKVARHVNYPQIIGKMRHTTGGLSWSLSINASGNLRARFDTQTPPATTGFNQVFDSTGKVEDSKWHHVALSYDHTTRKVKVYLDYTSVSEGTAINPLVIDSGDILIGNGDRAFDGWIDEVRLTGCVLQPHEFLHTMPNAGSTTAVQ